MTPHNNAKKGDIAKTVLMPGDPLRAKVIAEKYLTNPVCFNTVRNMFGYTGEYKGVKVSVMGSGMGMPSIGIYSCELYTQYEVENIIRIGSAGGMAEGVKLRDLIFAVGACTDSNYASQYKLPGTFSPTASFKLLRTAVEEAEKLGVEYKVGNMLSSDCFYNDNTEANAAWIKMGVLAVEMEAAALYMNAARLKKNALAMCTVSDLVDGSASLSAEDRQNTFNDMMVVALETAIKL